MFRVEHNVITNEITEIPLTAAEIKEIEKLNKKAATEVNTAKIEEQEKTQAKLVLFEKLGITAEEAQLLFS